MATRTEYQIKLKSGLYVGLVNITKTIFNNYININ